MIGSSNDETDFPHKLLLANTQVLKIRKAFANGSSANTKFSKTPLSKIVQLGGSLAEALVGILYIMKENLLLPKDSLES